MPFPFAYALEALKCGNKISRTGWNGKGMSLEIQRPDPMSKMTREYIFMNTVDGGRVPWVASQTDLLASDWEIIPA